MKNILVIPYWVQEQLARNKLRLPEVLEYEKARQVLSAHDMATLVSAAIVFENVIGKTGDLNACSGVPSNAIVEAWQASATAEQREDCNRVISLSYDDSIVADLRERLLSANAYDERHPQPFITYDLTPTTVGVVIYPGYFVEGTDYQDKSILLLESILRVFYAYDSHHEVAKHECFKHYLHLLSSRTVIV